MKNDENYRYTLKRRDEAGRWMYYVPAATNWLHSMPIFLLTLCQAEALLPLIRKRTPDAEIVDVIARRKENAIWLSGFRSVIPLGYVGEMTCKLRERAIAAAAAAVMAAGRPGAA